MFWHWVNRQCSICMFNICPVDLIQSNAVIKSADLFFTRSPEHHFQYPNIGNTLFGWNIIVFTKQQFYLQWLTDLKAFDILSLSIGIEIIYMYVCVCVCFKCFRRKGDYALLCCSLWTTAPSLQDTGRCVWVTSRVYAKFCLCVLSVSVSISVF